MRQNHLRIDASTRHAVLLRIRCRERTTTRAETPALASDRFAEGVPLRTAQSPS